MGSQPHAQPREWTAEKAALHEKKKIAQFQREREEERALKQLKKLQETTSGKPTVDPKTTSRSAKTHLDTIPGDISGCE
jgi:hypothetical protein